MRESEIRSLKANIRLSEDGSRKIEALAIPVNSRSELIFESFKKFYEIISPNAINENLIAQNDVKLYLDHDSSQGTFARSKFGEGSMELFITEEGLCFSTELPETAAADAILEGIKRGDYDAISFEFIPNEKSAEWSVDEEGNKIKVINEIIWLNEISILSQLPAYAATKINIRSYDEFVSKLEQQKAEEDEIHKRKLLKKLDGMLEFL